MSVRQFAVAVPLLAALAVPLSAAPASASGGGGGAGIRAAGLCSAHTSWKLKAKHDNARIELEAEVDSGRVGQTWAWSLTDNGSVAAGSAKTIGPSGSFSVSRFTADRSGTDRVSLRATNAATGQSCSGLVVLV